MQATKKAWVKHAPAQKTRDVSITADVGLILTDLSFNVIAIDRGAMTILSHPGRSDVEPDYRMPEEILTHLRGRRPSEWASVKAQFRKGKNEYICRMYLLESRNGQATEPTLAVHLEKDTSTNDAVYEAAVKYHLTEREQQVLRGISMGLATKEVATRLNISPNTVKAFLRLVMIKMGVTTRAATVAKVLHSDPEA
jgi:DNA-binding CsgD family transcriptional regulator